MKVWCTRYALTHGIEEVECEDEVRPEGLVKPIRSARPRGFMLEMLYSGEWHHSREKAIERAEAMRRAKVRTLERQLARMRALRFDKGGSSE